MGRWQNLRKFTSLITLSWSFPMFLKVSLSVFCRTPGLHDADGRVPQKTLKIIDSIFTMHIQVNLDSDLMSDSDLKQKFNEGSIAWQQFVYFERGSSNFNKLAICTMLVFATKYLCEIGCFLTKQLQKNRYRNWLDSSSNSSPILSQNTKRIRITTFHIKLDDL